MELIAANSIIDAQGRLYDPMVQRIEIRPQAPLAPLLDSIEPNRRFRRQLRGQRQIHRSDILARFLHPRQLRHTVGGAIADGRARAASEASAIREEPLGRCETATRLSPVADASMQAIHDYRETERLLWQRGNRPVIERMRESAFGPEEQRAVPALRQTHVLDLAADGFIKPHVDSVKVSIE